MYEDEIKNNNTCVDDWWFFSAYNVYEEFNKENAKESLDYICDLNKKTNDRINMNLVRDFEKFKKEAEKAEEKAEKAEKAKAIEIIPIDKKSQIVTFKNCNVFTHKNGIMITDNKNLFVGKNHFFPYTTEYVILKKKVVTIKDTVLSLNICNQTNYFHILIELVTRICLLEKYKSLKDIKIMVSNNLPSYGREMLNCFDFKEIIYYDDETFHCDEIVYVNIGVEDDEYNDCWGCYLPSKKAIDVTFEKFINMYGDENQDENQDENEKVVYISRGNTPVRNVINEDLLINKVLKPLYGDDLIIFDNDYLSKSKPNEKFKTQVSLFNKAKLVIGPHGAGLTNILFCKKDTPVIEFSMKPNCNRCFEYIAKYRDLNHISLKLFTAFYNTGYTFENKHVDEMREIMENINCEYNI